MRGQFLVAKSALGSCWWKWQIPAPMIFAGSDSMTSVGFDARFRPCRINRRYEHRVYFGCSDDSLVYLAEFSNQLTRKTREFIYRRPTTHRTRPYGKKVVIRSHIELQLETKDPETISAPNQSQMRLWVRPKYQIGCTRPLGLHTLVLSPLPCRWIFTEPLPLDHPPA